MIATSLLCLALTVHVEARGEPKEGQRAVASVVMNRVAKNDSDVCKEVTLPGQFPWARSKIRKTANGYVISDHALPSGESWDKSVKLAEDVLSGSLPVIPKVMFFHNSGEHPGWRRRLVLTLGRHLFYG